MLRLFVGRNRWLTNRQSSATPVGPGGRFSHSRASGRQRWKPSSPRVSNNPHSRSRDLRDLVADASQQRSTTTQKNAASMTSAAKEGGRSRIRASMQSRIYSPSIQPEMQVFRIRLSLFHAKSFAPLPDYAPFRMNPKGFPSGNKTRPK